MQSVRSPTCPAIFAGCMAVIWKTTSMMSSFAQQFAKRNRERMLIEILARTGLDASSAFHTIHNYIDVQEMILRKGAISAYEGETVLIPLNMRDGSIIAKGKGNAEWNNSAPHGAGRVMSRKDARETLNMDDYRASVKDIYTTSINKSTIDEAPAAYKSIEDIIEPISRGCRYYRRHEANLQFQSFVIRRLFRKPCGKAHSRFSYGSDYSSKGSARSSSVYSANSGAR